MPQISLKTNWTLLLSGPLLFLLCIPSLALLAHIPHLAWLWNEGQVSSMSALRISLESSGLTTLLTLIFGTPLAWFLAQNTQRTTQSNKRVRGLIAILVMTPLVLPPSIVGLTLLSTLNPNSWLGQHIPFLGSIAFSWWAVIAAQLTVASPLYIMGASAVFKQISPELIEMAQSLGASPWQCWRRVVLPMVLPGLLVALSLSWARAIGEFGATLLFAGHLPGITQTVPLAIYLELDHGTLGALALALGLLAYMLPILGLSSWLGRSPWRV